MMLTLKVNNKLTEEHEIASSKTLDFEQTCVIIPILAARMAW